MERETLVSVIIVNYNGHEFLDVCLSSLMELTLPKEQLEVILVDNGSTDGSVEFVESRFPNVVLIQNEANLGFSKAANLGAAGARGEYLAFLNNDMRGNSKGLSVLVETARKESDASSGVAFDPNDRRLARNAITEWLDTAHSLFESRVTKELAERTVELEEKTAQLEKQREALRSLSADVAEMEHQVSLKDEQLYMIVNSRSWRLVKRYVRVKHRILDFIQSIRATSRKYRPQRLIGIWKETKDRGTLRRPDKADVICFSIVNWDFRFQRPQHLMLQFVAAGHRVLYISQNIASHTSYSIQEKAENVCEISLLGLPQNVKGVLDDEACDVLFASLDLLRRDLSVGAAIAFVQSPFWWPLVERARAEFAWPIIYDCLDHHGGFSTTKDVMVKQEGDLVAAADLVVVSSGLLEERACQHNSNVMTVRNACDYEHFEKVGKTESERPVIGYYGAIAAWFDSDLVADLAERRPDWDFVLVGSTFTGDISRLSRLSNVFLPGEKPYSEIPDWLGRFDVAIIPFKRILLTEATNPVKAYEILAAGKPLVSVGIPEIAALVPLVRLAATALEFEKEILAALDENEPELTARRRAFARKHTWKDRYDVLAPAIRKAFPKLSIIIVTFNNLDLNRLCLESIYAHTEWPNFEVIVVDNASTDETPNYLRVAENTFANLRVVINGSNLGFAAANNIGLEIANGDYLVILNNDTIVTRGWVSALVRHLKTNPRIGMIGPVTNSIHNNAKVKVGYKRVKDMPSWAAKYVRQHDGVTFPISMLAMFCVVIRRDVFEQVGLLDERFGVGMFEDDDYCRRLEECGYELRCARDSFVHHWQRASFRLLGEKEYTRIYEENRIKFERKWNPESTGNQAARDSPFQSQLQKVLARVGQSKGAVIILPSIGWDTHLFQRPHHLAREFARQGYTVIFDASNAFAVEGFKEIESNLFLFRGPEDLLHTVPDPVLWAFPYNYDRKDAYPNTARTVYDWIDDLEVFPYDRAFMERNHHRALREANVVTSVSGTLHERAIRVRSNAIYLPNAVDYEKFAGESPVPKDVTELIREGKPIAGYYGALAEWFDYELLDHLARLRRDWNFLLIGPILDPNRHKLLIPFPSNVKWIGPRPYSSLPGYLGVFDVAMIPFVTNNITQATSPLKLYEYFAGGKAVISTPMPENERFSDVMIVRDVEAFSQSLDRAREVGRDEAYRERVRALARENSWTARVQTVLDVMQRNQSEEPAQRPASTVAVPLQCKPALLNPQKLVGAAAQIADRFRRF